MAEKEVRVTPETKVLESSSAWADEPVHTFEEDKLAIVTLVGRIDITGQTNPEDRYRHGIVIEDPVPTHAPEPATLHRKQACIVLLVVIVYIAVDVNASSSSRL